MIYGARADQQQAARTLFIIRNDEHGSFYDHVAPPTIGVEEIDGPFQQLGFRVPPLVLRPGVKKGMVSPTPFDHVSLLKTLTDRFDIEWTRSLATAVSTARCSRARRSAPNGSRRRAPSRIASTRTAPAIRRPPGCRSCGWITTSSTTRSSSARAGLQSATKSVDLEGKELSDIKIVSALVAAKKAGAAVRVVLADNARPSRRRRP